ncbi:hypothetical protein ABZ951_27625 [Streptomyces sp. NPDC046215]
MSAGCPSDDPVRGESVLVVHSAPAYRCGLALALKESGFGVHESDSIELSGGMEWDACLLHVPSDDMSEVGGLKQIWPSRSVVALLTDPTVDDYRSALRAGVEGLVAHDADLDEIGEVLRCALRGDVRIPAAVARALAERTPAVPGAPDLSVCETGLLRDLASGRAVAEIAKSSGYSERHMYRRVQHLYSRVGARNRSEAVAAAARWGLLADTGSGTESAVHSGGPEFRRAGGGG